MIPEGMTAEQAQALGYMPVLLPYAWHFIGYVYAFLLFLALQVLPRWRWVICATIIAVVTFGYMHVRYFDGLALEPDRLKPLQNTWFVVVWFGGIAGLVTRAMVLWVGTHASVRIKAGIVAFGTAVFVLIPCIFNTVSKAAFAWERRMPEASCVYDTVAIDIGGQVLQVASKDIGHIGIRDMPELYDGVFRTSSQLRKLYGDATVSFRRPWALRQYCNTYKNGNLPVKAIELHITRPEWHSLDPVNGALLTPGSILSVAIVTPRSPLVVRALDGLSVPWDAYRNAPSGETARITNCSLSNGSSGACFDTQFLENDIAVFTTYMSNEESAPLSDFESDAVLKKYLSDIGL